MKMIIFDLDDTLLRTLDLYAEARDRFLKFMNDLGFPSSEVLAVFEERENVNIPKYGVSPERYPLSMEETYVILCKKYEYPVNPMTKKRVGDFARWIFRQVPDIIHGAIETLKALQGIYRLILVTRGVRAIQNYKLEKTGLIKYFDAIYIVDSKTDDDYRGILQAEELEPSEEIWIVGDSIKSDINPGLRLGLRCIHIPYKLPHYSWHQDEESPISDNYIQIPTLKELPQTLLSAQNEKNNIA